MKKSLKRTQKLNSQVNLGVTYLMCSLSGPVWFHLLSAKGFGPLLLWLYKSCTRNSLVVVADTVNSAVCVHRERLTLQAPSADHTAKAGRVVGLPTSLQDLTMQNELFFTQCKSQQWKVTKYIYASAALKYSFEVLVLYLYIYLIPLVTFQTHISKTVYSHLYQLL